MITEKNENSKSKNRFVCTCVQNNVRQSDYRKKMKNLKVKTVYKSNSYEWLIKTEYGFRLSLSLWLLWKPLKTVRVISLAYPRSRETQRDFVVSIFSTNSALLHSQSRKLEVAFCLFYLFIQGEKKLSLNCLALSVTQNG